MALAKREILLVELMCAAVDGVVYRVSLDACLEATSMCPKARQAMSAAEARLMSSNDLVTPFLTQALDPSTYSSIPQRPNQPPPLSSK